MDHWIVVHWFELSTLLLLGLNLWFVASVLGVLRETSRWLEFLSVRWERLAAVDRNGPGGPSSLSNLED
jgi:hypothetical protein